MQNSTYIKEIFTSIQGEGPYIGCNQLFIRFSKCNLNCKYCDTDFRTDLTLYEADKLASIVNNTNNIHSVSLTGGEPLMETDFLTSFLPLVNKKIYLETNGTLTQNLRKIINYIDIISMDIKLNSSSAQENLYKQHQDFIETSVEYQKEIFLKIVFDESITSDEINQCIELAKKYHLLIILQPKMDKDLLKISTSEICEIYNRFNIKYDNIRLIPQVHKFINVQ